MRAILMDLQGTLGGNPLGDITSFEFYPKVIEGLQILQAHGYRLIVVTNQSRISKGIISKEDYEKKKNEIILEAKENGIKEIQFYCCPHTDNDKCTCRKPKIGLYEEANNQNKIDIEQSYMIGDMGMSDMMFAHNIGLKKVLVLTGVGKGSLNEYRESWIDADPNYIADDFLKAALWIEKEFKEIC